METVNVDELLDQLKPCLPGFFKATRNEYPPAPVFPKAFISPLKKLIFTHKLEEQAKS
jgi:hypothetical protein